MFAGTNGRDAQRNSFTNSTAGGKPTYVVKRVYCSRRYFANIQRELLNEYNILTYVCVPVVDRVSSDETGGDCDILLTVPSLQSPSPLHTAPIGRLLPPLTAPQLPPVTPSQLSPVTPSQLPPITPSQPPPGRGRIVYPEFVNFLVQPEVDLCRDLPKLPGQSDSPPPLPTSHLRWRSATLHGRPHTHTD